MRRPVRLPQTFVNAWQPNGAAPAPTDDPARRPFARNTTGARLPRVPRARGPRSTPPLHADADVRPSFSLTGDVLSLVLPVPPSINRQYATVNGRRVLAAAGRHYKRTVGQLLMAGAAASSSDWHRFLREAGERAMTLTMRCYFPTLLRRDLDGGIKITQDALCEAMNLNDNRILELHLYKISDRDHPRLECTLTLTTGLRPSRRTRPGRRTG